MNNSSDDWARPPSDLAEKKKTRERILKVLEEKKISYPAEIVAMTGMNRQTVFDNLAQMVYDKSIERVKVTAHKCPLLLRNRLNELWDIGLKGGAIRRMSWYKLPNGENGE